MRDKEKERRKERKRKREEGQRSDCSRHLGGDIYFIANSERSITLSLLLLSCTTPCRRCCHLLLSLFSNILPPIPNTLFSLLLVTVHNLTTLISTLTYFAWFLPYFFLSCLLIFLSLRLAIFIYKFKSLFKFFLLLSFTLYLFLSLSFYPSVSLPFLL